MALSDREPLTKEGEAGGEQFFVLLSGEGASGVSASTALGEGPTTAQMRHFSSCSSWFTKAINTIQNKVTAPGPST